MEHSKSNARGGSKSDHRAYCNGINPTEACNHPLLEVFIVSGVESSRAEVHIIGLDLSEDAVVEV